MPKVAISRRIKVGKRVWGEDGFIRFGLSIEVRGTGQEKVVIRDCLWPVPRT